MSGPVLRPGHLAAATLTLGGLLLLAAPGRAEGVVRLVLVTLAAAGVLHAVLVHAAPALQLSPFRWRLREDGAGEGAGAAARLRSALAGRRHRVAGGRPLPPAAVRLLQPLIEAALERDGAAADDPIRRAEALGRLSPLTRAVLDHDATLTPAWFRTLGPDPGAAAEVVDAVLDDLESALHADRSDTALGMTPSSTASSP